jgi:DNA-binding CsgD family transcriptional regulator
MVEADRDGTIEQFIFRIAESRTPVIKLQEDLVRDLCAHLLHLRAAFPDQPAEWYRRSCELRADQYLRQSTAPPKTVTRWLPELKDETFVARLTPRLTPKQQQVLALLLEDIGIREAGRRLGVSHVAVIKHRRKIERAANRLLQAGAAAAVMLLLSYLPPHGVPRSKAISAPRLTPPST